MRESLKPCPFCGSDDLHIERSLAPPASFYVLCECGASAEHPQAWNTRAAEIQFEALRKALERIAANWSERTETGQIARAALAGSTVESAVCPVPAGWALVPMEPTEPMLRAAFVAMNETPSGEWKRMKAEGVTPRRMFDVKMAPRYRAMVSAAPTPPKAEADQ